ncbi:MAG: c-type cytochrome biogenesis protein CcmI, partial [Motiliproteus sp.]|nr:c-type cytochrome biogenesis protein CcmI [Motiliproteus sp.]
MVTFWLLSALLVALALLFFWLPFFKRADSADADIDRNELNVEIFKSRLAELEQELADNNLDQAGFDELKTELEKSLLTEVDDSQQRFEHKRPNLLVPISLSVLIPL